MSTWKHYVWCGTKVRTKEDAVEAMFAYYDEHPGRRRKKARDSFRVVRTVHMVLGWVVYVAPRRGRAT